MIPLLRISIENSRRRGEDRCNPKGMLKSEAVEIQGRPCKKIENSRKFQGDDSKNLSCIQYFSGKEQYNIYQPANQK